MRLFAPLVIVFAMFARLPMPRVAWQERNLRFALCFFPLVGLVQGVAAGLWGWLALRLALPQTLTAVGFTLLPVLYNGGIHLDGLADTADALASNAERARRLEILRDPRVGVFGVLALICHLLLLCGAFSAFAVTRANLLALAAIYTLSRALSGATLLLLPPAKPDGLARRFALSSAQRPVVGVLLLWSMLAAAALCWLHGWLGLVLVVAALLVVCYYRRFALKQFGGVSGDLQGWFLQTLELVLLLVLVVGGNC